MRREFLQKHWEVMEAFKNGAEVQFQDLTGIWMDCEHPTFAGNIEFRIKPKPVKRLPTIQEVEQWFLENKVFKIEGQNCLQRIISLDKDHDQQIIIGKQRFIDIEQLCEDFTHLDGTELYINE